MAGRISVTDVDIAREFRLRRVAGPAINALRNPALRLCLRNCAELRKKQLHADQPTPDGKRLASGDPD
ncbi:MAG TPA: hypothetical protein VM659_20490 [Dongiaceae bacterium]|nr:hypothetical protein [Dongiaceae bacterium]